MRKLSQNGIRVWSRDTTMEQILNQVQVLKTTQEKSAIVTEDWLCIFAIYQSLRKIVRLDLRCHRSFVWIVYCFSITFLTLYTINQFDR